MLVYTPRASLRRSWIYRALTAGLDAAGLTHGAALAYATPRRLAVHVTNVAAKAADKPVQQKLHDLHN